MIGGVFLQGIGVYPLYLKSALDQLKISMHVIKAGVYKDAAETFLRDSMSDESKQSTAALIEDLWGRYLDRISKHRGVSTETIFNYINEYDVLLAGGAKPARIALDAGLVDKIVSRLEWREEMEKLIGKNNALSHSLSYRSYLKSNRPSPSELSSHADKVAVIMAKGTILDGEQPAGNIGGDTLSALIRQASRSSNIKAIVLRVDSPGGSASASELIRSALAAAQAKGKPVVASMGGYAASGGYWISSTSDKIFASDSTVTGSIGVFSLFPTFERSLEHLGVRSDGVGTTGLSNAMDNFSEINPIFRRVLQSSVNRTYNEFLELVSEGRGLSIEVADSIAQGRVWSGSSALKHGLIDGIGDLEHAIEESAKLAGLEKYEVVYLEKVLSPKERILKEILHSTLRLLPALTIDLPFEVPSEIDILKEVVQSPSLYLQCTSCDIRF